MIIVNVTTPEEVEAEQERNKHPDEEYLGEGAAYAKPQDFPYYCEDCEKNWLWFPDKGWIEN